MQPLFVVLLFCVLTHCVTSALPGYSPVSSTDIDTEIDSSAKQCVAVLTSVIGHKGIKADIAMYEQFFPGFDVFEMKQPFKTQRAKFRAADFRYAFLMNDFPSLAQYQFQDLGKIVSGPIHKSWRTKIDRFETWAMINAEDWYQKEFEWNVRNANLNVVVAKTRSFAAALKEMRAEKNLEFDIFFSKHESHDLSLPDVKMDFNKFLHVASSRTKQTGVLVEAWRRNPDFPMLSIVAARNNTNLSHFWQFWGEIKTRDGRHPANIRLYEERLTMDELKQLANSHGVHMCLSRLEGYGHVINEGRSVGAFVVTTNLPPMNELIHSNRGFLVTPDKLLREGLAQEGIITQPSIVETAVRKIVAMSESTKRRKGRNARRKFEQDTAFFHERMRQFKRCKCDQDQSACEGLFE